MNHWIFTVTSKKINNKTFTAEEIFEQRMMDTFWGIGEKTPNRNNLRKGDKVIYYLGLPLKEFGGEATLESDLFELDDQQKFEFKHGSEIYQTDYGVHLKDISIWKIRKPVEDLVPKLGFIENKEYWFSYFQGGVRQISVEDYQIITGQRVISLVEELEKTRDLESQTEFALEAQLEEFLYQNWSNIDWGTPLDLYRTDEIDRRQFPAGTWSIDFLAIDKYSKELVVIELKRGKTSDSTVGQILSYMNWIQENIAEKGQKVRGIIIAKDVDDALKYAVKSLINVSIKTYKVDFRLNSVSS